MNGYRLAKLLGVVDGLDVDDEQIAIANATRMLLDRDEPGTYILIPADEANDAITFDARLKVEVTE